MFAELYYQLTPCTCSNISCQQLFHAVAGDNKYSIDNLFTFTIFVYIESLVNSVIRFIFISASIFRSLFISLSKENRKYDCVCETCMIIWVREPKRRRLTRVEPEPELDLAKMAGQDRI